MMLDTSLDAWSKVKSTITLRQKEIFEAVLEYPDRTTAELADKLVKPVNTISGRFSELGPGTEKNPGINIIARSGRRICTRTKGMAYTWRVV